VRCKSTQQALREAPMSLKSGEIVHLKSGGPDMTVQSLDGDHVWCQWFGGRKLERGRFPIVSLNKGPSKPEKK
jgi:uncharacterized protein YodC (DUF2158 family)